MRNRAQPSATVRRVALSPIAAASLTPTARRAACATSISVASAADAIDPIADCFEHEQCSDYDSEHPTNACFDAVNASLTLWADQVLHDGTFCKNRPTCDEHDACIEATPVTPS
jgi:hypothetical protein